MVGVINTARRIIKTLTISECSIVLLLGVLWRITTQRTSLLLLSCSVKFIHHNLHLICSFLAILLNLFDKNFNHFLHLLGKLLTLCNFFFHLIETLERQCNIVKISIDCRILLLVLNNFVECSAILQDYVLLLAYLVFSLLYKFQEWTQFLLIFNINRFFVSCVLEHPHHVFSWVQIIFEIFSFLKLRFLLFH